MDLCLWPELLCFSGKQTIDAANTIDYSACEQRVVCNAPLSSLARVLRLTPGCSVDGRFPVDGFCAPLHHLS